jgi:hypothetical protein
MMAMTDMALALTAAALISRAMLLIFLFRHVITSLF